MTPNPAPNTADGATVLLTVGELRDRWKVSEESIHRWCRDGSLPFVLLPSGTRGLRRFRLDDIVRFEQSYSLADAGAA